MSEKRFKIIHLGNPYDFVVKDFKTNKTYGTSDDDKNYLVDLLNEQQSFIDLLFNELVEAQKQGYVVNFLHKNEHCSLIPKEIYDE